MEELWSQLDAVAALLLAVRDASCFNLVASAQRLAVEATVRAMKQLSAADAAKAIDKLRAMGWPHTDSMRW